MAKNNWKWKRTSIFNSITSTIHLTGKVNSYNTDDFCSAIHLFNESGKDRLIVNFSKVEKVYPNGMLPIISIVTNLRNEGKEVSIILPQKDEVRKMFRSVNWAYYLDPERNEKSESLHDRHLVTRNFTNLDEQQNAVNDFMDMVLRNLSVSKDIIAGLLWSINEITDNVMNHSNSFQGGFVQASTHPKNNIIAFAVVDGGRGILNSLKRASLH